MKIGEVVNMADDILQINETDRYARLRLIAWWDQDRIARANVLVVGAGALGNEVLKNLALLGIGQITVVDFDTIDDTNLTRSILFRARDVGRRKVDVAAETIRDINPDVAVRAVHGNIITDIGLGCYADADVVIGCLDNREARLWVNRCCWKVNTPWIDGGIQEINGVAKVFVPPDGPCYECAMTEMDYRLINLRYSCPLLRHEDLLAGKIPTAPTIASIVGGLQTQDALKLIHGLPVSSGGALVFNGQANSMYATRFPLKEDCLSHDTWPEPIRTELTSGGHTGRELVQVAARHFPDSTTGPMEISLERDLVVSLDCACGKSRPIMRPRELVRLAEATCPSCGKLSQPRMKHEIRDDSPLIDRKLGELGIPAYDMVRITRGEDEVFLLLAGDHPGGSQA